MAQYLSNLREQTAEGLREFSEHPIDYTSNSIAGFVKDYWDLGAATLGGIAFNDYNHEVFGCTKDLVTVLGCIGALSVGDERRTARNVAGGFAGLSAFWNTGLDSLPGIGNYVATAVFGAGSLIMDSWRDEDFESF